jgi:hypothetical protein
VQAMLYTIALCDFHHMRIARSCTLAGMQALTGAPNTQPTNDFDEVHVLLARRLPGVRLDSVVQGWAYLEEFERGIEAFARIRAPTPEDDRWLGVCYFKLFDDTRALDMFIRAGDRGALGARVNQAHLLRCLERSADSARILDSIDPNRLSRYDQVLYFRVRSIHEETGGNIGPHCGMLKRLGERRKERRSSMSLRHQSLHNSAFSMPATDGRNVRSGTLSVASR